MTDKGSISGAAAPRRRRGLVGLPAMRLDDVLLPAVFVALILVIAALGYLVYAALARPVAPRTDVERRVYYYEQGVKASPKEVKMWAAYAGALVEAGQYSKASGVIADALRKFDDKAGLLVQRAGMEHERGQDDRALKTADEAIAAVEAYQEKIAAENAKKGMGAPLGQSPEIIQAEVLKAEIYADRGQAQRAIDAYTRALKQNGLMSDVLAARGDLYRELNDFANAREDYREALKYDPENVVARDGLEKLGDVEK